MAADARDYADVLHEAQARGYAEADPASDVEGLDAAYKLTLLARLAFGTWIDVDALRRSRPDGRAGCTPRDHRRSPRGAQRRGTPGHDDQAHRACGAQSDDRRIRAAVTPMAVSASSPLGSNTGVTNLVDFEARPVGRVTFRAPAPVGPRPRARSSRTSSCSAQQQRLDVGAAAAGSSSGGRRRPCRRAWLVGRRIEGLGAAADRRDAPRVDPGLDATRPS